jgi:DNA adenine methylase
VSTALTPPLKWHGGKHYLAPKIVALMPPHTHYVEPYAGGLAVLLAKDPEGCQRGGERPERGLSNFWDRATGRGSQFAKFVGTGRGDPFSEEEWDKAVSMSRPPVAGRCAFFIKCRQSLAGRMQSFAPLSRTRTRRGMNEQASAWLNAVEGCPRFTPGSNASSCSTATPST